MKTEDSGALRDMDRGVAEWLTGGDGLCQWSAAPLFGRISGRHFNYSF